jgi:prepilin-type N-terminal cleavage/methylation domain-containing protein
MYKKHNQNLNYKQKGFTVIELLVVISVISLLSSVIMVSLVKARAKGRDARRLEDVKVLSQAIQLYIGDTGTPPPGNNEAANDYFNYSSDPAGFITSLKSSNYITGAITGPVPGTLLHTGNFYNYAYFRYPPCAPDLGLPGGPGTCTLGTQSAAVDNLGQFCGNTISGNIYSTNAKAALVFFPEGGPSNVYPKYFGFYNYVCFY